MMQLDAVVFGYNKFQLNDTTLFSTAETIILKQKVVIVNTNNLNIIALKNDNPCDIIEVWYDPDGKADACDCSGNEYYTGEWYYAGNCGGGGTMPLIITIIGGTGPAGGSGNSYTIPNLGGLTGGAGGNPPYTPITFTFLEKRTYLSDQLTLDTNSKNWLLNNEAASNELFNYLYGHFTYERLDIAKKHLQKLMVDVGYNTFVQTYRVHYLGRNTMMWWEDNTWLSNPNNFNLDVDASNNQYDELTQAEKDLVNLYPIEGYAIGKNATKAIHEAQIRFPNTGLLNDKGDAFRHAYWMAMNERDCGENRNFESIAYKFGVAHESETPSVLHLEKDMDLFNNSVGITVASAYIFPLFNSDATVATDLYQKLSTGQLKYLKPLNFNISGLYDANRDHIQDCLTCLNGIMSATVLTPTNQ